MIQNSTVLASWFNNTVSHVIRCNQRRRDLVIMMIQRQRQRIIPVGVQQNRCCNYRQNNIYRYLTVTSSSMAKRMPSVITKRRQIKPTTSAKGSDVKKSINNNNNNHNHNTASNDEASTSISSRKLFQQIPIHTSIIDYIRTIGVGIAPRDTSGRRGSNSRRNIRFSHKYNSHGNEKSNNNNNNGIAASSFKPRGRLPQEERKLQKLHRDEELQQQNVAQNTADDDDRPWIPPPPFGPTSVPVQLIASVGPEDVIFVEENENIYDGDDHNAEDGNDDDHHGSITTATTMKENIYPKNLSQIPEIAIIGRSNVGKSTLLNALLYGHRNTDSDHVIKKQHKVKGHVPNNLKLPKGVKAVTSPKPGETKQISFYKLTSHVPINNAIPLADDNITQQQQQQQQQAVHRSILLVDLPGYGFAYAKERDAIAYRTMMLHYLLQRGKSLLQRVLLLVDARHGMKKADIDFLLLLEKQHIQNVQHQAVGSRQSYTLPFPVQIVLTKCDLVIQSDLARRVTQVRQQLSDLLRREPGQLPIMLVSARPGVGFNNVDPNTSHHVPRGGIFELQKELAGLAQPILKQQQQKES